ncbi:PucR family transcriptional regulator [Defluviitalea phaphyphila]|uniref:PucR family transcriptional regulator n=1 Tax=Defluviitalea phaphyphila TaxID=1473580 RepID=UPI0007319DA9|nr:PucR family transcriptional regulator ligand-binding domain-containing protein [Defluviitalea phaphyphila]
MITIKKLIENADENYQLELIAGEEGLDRIVQWIHIVEDEEVSEFLHGNEMIFTTGIRRKDLEWMLDFVKRFHKYNASALVINIGPYIKYVPEEVIEYCKKHEFPLFVIPWKTRLVDVTRDFCNQIIKSEQVEMSITEAFKNAIFQVEDEETYFPVLARYGYDLKDKFSLVIIKINTQRNNEDQYINMVHFHCERILNRGAYKYTIFSYQKKLILVLSALKDKEIKNIVNEILSTCGKKEDKYSITIAVGYNRKGIETIALNFKRTMETLRLARKRRQKVLYYDELGIYKLLLNSDDYTAIIEFYNETVGKLKAYDKENKTQYVDFLKKYLELDGKVQTMAEKEFLHRNTVHYHLNKIKKIIDCDFNNLNDNLKILLGFYIEEIL